MSNQRKRVDEGRAVCNSEQDEWRDQIPESSQIATRIKEEVDQTIAFLKRSTETQFWDVEKKVVSLVFTLGRLFLAFQLAWCHEHFDVRKLKRPGLHIKRAQPRLLGTYFGKVRYWRTYLRRKGGSGLYPLDAALGLTADGFQNS